MIKSAWVLRWSFIISFMFCVCVFSLYCPIIFSAVYISTMPYRPAEKTASGLKRADGLSAESKCGVFVFRNLRADAFAAHCDIGSLDPELERRGGRVDEAVDEDAVLLRAIENDVRRVRADAPALASLGVRCACARILFATAHELADAASPRRDVSWFYRQSMCELLAVVLNVLATEALSLAHSPTLDAFTQAHDDRHVEADVARAR